MTDLVVAFQEQAISNGGRVAGPQLMEQLRINYSPISDIDFYTIKVENADTGKTVLFLINNDDVNAGEDLVPEPDYLEAGDYRVTLYSQPGEIEASTEEEAEGEGLEALRSVSFIVGPATYGQRRRSPVRGKKVPSLSEPLSAHRERGRSSIIVSGKLPEKQRKLCACLVESAMAQSASCLQQRRWGDRIAGRTCYSPEAVCKTAVGYRGNVMCLKYYLLDEMNDGELVAVGVTHGQAVPKSWDGEKLSKGEKTALLKVLKKKQAEE